MAFDFINYYKLDWIESTGTQYIDTGWSKGSGDDGPIIHMDFEFTDTSSSLQGLFGCNHGSTYQYRQYIGANTNNTWYLRWRNSEYTSSATWALNTRYDLEAKLRRDNKYIKIDGTNVISNTSYESNYPSLVMYLFALNNNGTAQNFSNIRLYSASLYSETTLVRDFVPAQRKSDDVVGLYDVLNEIFYTNSGTGSFIASPTHDVDETVYAKLEYIEATGTQYIDTGLTDAQQTNLIVEADIAWTVTSGDMGFIASRQTSGDTRRYFAYGYNGNWQSGFNTLASTGVSIVANEKKHVETKISNGDSYMKFDGVTVATSTASYTATGTKTLTIFAANAYNSVVCYAKGRLYSFKAYDCSNNNALLRDFVPVKRLSDGVLGLYDKVNDVFYVNAGTGSFSSANEYHDQHIEDYDQLEYLESTGTQYIDLGIKGNLNTEAIIRFNKVTASTNNTLSIFGDNTTTSSAVSLNLTTINSTARTARFSDKSISISSVSTLLKTNYTIKINKTGIFVDDISIGSFNASTSFTTTNNLTLFKINGVDISTYSNGITRIYWAKVYDESNLVRDLIPVKNKINGFIGIYDLVNNVFYTNTGSGEFVEPVLFSSYKKVTYIETTGTQYINTYIIGRNFNITADFEQTTNKASDNVIIGITNRSTSSYRAEVLANYGYALGIWNSSSSATVRLATVLPINTRKSITLTQTNNSLTLTDGEETVSQSPTTAITNYMYLFAYYGSSWIYGTFKLYGCTISVDDVLRRNYIPVMRKSDNVLGLYDTVNDVFYTNEGTGTFYSPLCNINDYRQFNYSGYPQTIRIIEPGVYKLEVWGAAGGASLNNGTVTGAGGAGGYSIGYARFPKDTVLYIVCGGKGANGAKSKNAVGGYNGGGNGTSDNNDDESAGAGGGATHIALVDGTLANIGKTSFDENGFIVAGGGGGKSWTYTPGKGGGLSGTNGDSGAAGTQTTGYAFGQGQNASGTGDSDGVGGGGGGYYGGYMSNTANHSSGGGGSGYIGGVPEFTFKNVTYTPETSVGINTGAGYAKITFIDTSFNCWYKLNGEWKPSIIYKKINNDWITGDIFIKKLNEWIEV